MRYWDHKAEGKVKTEYVLSGQPTGWAAMDKVLRDYDEEKVKDYKEDIDNLLTFVCIPLLAHAIPTDWLLIHQTGLFSGVLASFLIESYPKLLADPSGGSSSDLPQGSLSSAAVSPHPSSPFRPAAGDIRINVLWFASLLLSLIAASFGILVKQWLREYMSFVNPSPQARLRVRHLRYPTLDRWWVFQIAAFLPILVHLSLGLFFIGLIYFTAAVHPSIEYTTIPLVGTWGLCFLIFAGLPLFFPRCPYRITILKDIYAYIHRIVGLLAARAASKFDNKTTSKALPNGWRMFCKRTSWRWISWNQRLFRKVRKGDSLTRKFLKKVPKEIFHWVFWRQMLRTMLSRILHKVAHSCERVNEIEVAHSNVKDLKVLSDADGSQSNDELLLTDIIEAALQVDLGKAPPHAAPKFIHELLCNRLAFPQDDDDHCFATILNLRKTTLSKRVQDAIVDLVVQFIPRLPLLYKDLPMAISRLRLNTEYLPHETKFLHPWLLFALLLRLSGRSLEEVLRKPLQEAPGQPLQERSPFIIHLSPLKRGAEIFMFCREIAQSSLCDDTIRNPHRKTSSPNDRLVNLLHGISLVHTAVQAQWSLAEALRSTGFITKVYRELDDLTIIPDSLDKAQRLLTSLGCRAMHYVVTLDHRIGRLDRAVVNDVLHGLYSEVQKRMEKPLVTSSPQPVESILKVDTVTLDGLAMFISFQSWRPQWFRLENLWSEFLPNQVGEAQKRIFTLAVCCVPTIGILRLCWRAASHSHSSGRRVIKGECSI